MRARRSPVVDSHDARALGVATRPIRLLRIALAAAAVLALAASVASARDLDVRDRSVLPTGSTGVVVLDLSLSISDADYRDVRRMLRRLIASDPPVGLVVFSDVPYELLPPGTPARELRPFLRLLEPARPRRPPNPWTQSFRAGTRISSALVMAREMLDRDRVENGSILLASDLQTAPEDVPVLIRTLHDLRDRSIAVRILPLSPLTDGRLTFESVIGEKSFAAPAQSSGGRDRELREEGRIRLPTGLLALAALLFAVLAAHERFAARLALPRPARTIGMRLRRRRMGVPA